MKEGYSTPCHKEDQFCYAKSVIRVGEGRFLRCDHCEWEWKVEEYKQPEPAIISYSDPAAMRQLLYDVFMEGFMSSGDGVNTDSTYMLDNFGVSLEGYLEGQFEGALEKVGFYQLKGSNDNHGL